MYLFSLQLMTMISSFSQAPFYSKLPMLALCRGIQELNVVLGGTLHQNIQDRCNEAGIEILSPHFRGLRDGNALQVPTDAIPPGHRTASFRVSRTNGEET